MSHGWFLKACYRSIAQRGSPCDGIFSRTCVEMLNRVSHYMATCTNRLSTSILSFISFSISVATIPLTLSTNLFQASRASHNNQFKHGTLLTFNYLSDNYYMLSSKPYYYLLFAGQVGHINVRLHTLSNLDFCFVNCWLSNVLGNTGELICLHAAKLVYRCHSCIISWTLINYGCIISSTSCQSQPGPHSIKYKS